MNWLLRLGLTLLAISISMDFKINQTNLSQERPSPILIQIFASIRIFIQYLQSPHITDDFKMECYLRNIIFPFNRSRHQPSFMSPN